MADGLRPYPDYRDSGAPWLGDMPSHWDTKRAKSLFEKMQHRVEDSDDVVTCFRDGIVTLRKTDAHRIHQCAEGDRLLVPIRGLTAQASIKE